MSNIPKIIHQIWIGSIPPPQNFLKTWREKHEKIGFEYILWTEEEMKKRNFHSKLLNKINKMPEINGKADIFRWEILYKYGGVFADADSYCIEPVTDLVLKHKAFIGYENEQIRGKGWAPEEVYGDILSHLFPLLATGTMAFPKNHLLPKMAIEWISNNDIFCIPEYETIKTAWRTVGPGLLTRLYWENHWEDITLLPSYYFIPIHNSGLAYTGHEKIYAHQEWCSSFDTYDSINNVKLPNILFLPEKKISILISSFNTKAIFIKECLNSIKSQKGHIFFEIIWINDGSDKIHTRILKILIESFEKTARFCKIKYYENSENMGIGFSLNRGINLCSNEIIIKMDAEDIMVKDRIQKQIEFMEKNPRATICGGQILTFDSKTKINISRTNHKTTNWVEYKDSPSSWFINNSTICYKKSKVLEVGNYNLNLKCKNNDILYDFELMLRMLKKYKKIYNLSDILLHHRLHENRITQLTYVNENKNEYRDNIKKQIVAKIFKDD